MSRNPIKMPPFNSGTVGRFTVGTLVAVGVVIVLLMIVLSSAFTTVPAGTRGVLRTFGEITGVYGEGLHFRTPFITDVISVDVRTQRYVSDSSAASSDLQTVTTQIVINYRPDQDRVDALIREIGLDYEARVIDPAVQEALKAATAQFTAEELITRRPEVSATIKDVLSSRLLPRGIIVEDVSITSFNFSEDFARAIEAKQVAEQDVLRARRELERAQVEAQQQVAVAEAQAEARLKIASAEAEALRLQREVISPELLQLRFIENWNGVLPRFTSGNGGIIPLINLPEGEFSGEDPTAGPAPTAAPLPTAAPEAPAPTEPPIVVPTLVPSP